MAFRLINKNLAFPPLYPKVEREDPTINDKGWDRVGGFTLRDKVDYMPQPGLQEDFCRCESNLILMCGAMSMGKTFAMDLKALYGVDKPAFSAAMISVRAMDSKKGSSMLRDAIEVCGKFGECDVNSSDVPTLYWERWNSSFRLIHSNFNADNPTEWEDFKDYAKKVQASYIAIDEATQIKQFKMFSYWFGRNRDASGMTPQMALSFNPEHTHWTTQMLLDAGYLDSNWILKPEMNGVTRYFYIKGDTPESIIWGDTPEEVAKLADIQLSERDKAVGATINQIVKSFTCFTGEAADNKKLVAATKGQSLGNLHAVGGTQRSIVKGAYFGPIDNEEINVNRQMIHNLWENPINDDENMYATLDVSGGSLESDNAPMLIWKGLRLIDIKFFRGDPKQLVEWIESTLRQYSVPVGNFAYDATGLGYYLRAYTSGMPITANKRCLAEYDVNGNQVQIDEYFNLRSQLLGRTEVMLKKGEISFGVDKALVIPYGKGNQTRRLIDVLFDEMNVFITEKRNKKIYYRSKDEYKSKFKSSPDLMDALSYRAIFELDTRERKQPKPQVPQNAYYGLYHRPKIVGGWGRYR